MGSCTGKIIGCAAAREVVNLSRPVPSQRHLLAEFENSSGDGGCVRIESLQCGYGIVMGVACPTGFSP